MYILHQFTVPSPPFLGFHDFFTLFMIFVNIIIWPDPILCRVIIFCPELLLSKKDTCTPLMSKTGSNLLLLIFIFRPNFLGTYVLVPIELGIGPILLLCHFSENSWIPKKFSLDPLLHVFCTIMLLTVLKYTTINVDSYIYHQILRPNKVYSINIKYSLYNIGYIVQD